MRKGAVSVMVLAGSLVLFVPSRAQDLKDAFVQGDTLRLEQNLNLKRKDDAANICLKKGSKLRVIRQDGDKVEFVRSSRSYLGGVISGLDNDEFKIGCDKDLTNLGDADADGHIYVVEKDDLPREYYRRSGITHGALFVPFKRRKDKALSGESNLGYYLGYRLDGPWGVTITPAGTVGMSLVNVGDNLKNSDEGADSTKESGTRAAFTYAVGLILTHVDSFQVGVFYGYDRIGGDVGKVWKYEGQPWYSVAIGYAFSR